MKTRFTVTMAAVCLALASLSGCGGEEQTAACAMYLTCCGQYNEITEGTDNDLACAESSYGTEGTCWETSENAETCNASCLGAVNDPDTGYVAVLGDDAGDCAEVAE